MGIKTSQPGYVLQTQSAESDQLVLSLSGRVSLDDADRLLAERCDVRDGALDHRVPHAAHLVGREFEIGGIGRGRHDGGIIDRSQD